MEKDLDLRFVCKLCDKKFPCGKSLGGHMRSHVIAAAANSAESDEKIEPMRMKNVSSLIGGSNFKGDLEAAAVAGPGGLNNEVGGPSGYGLRENPKKTWRAVDSSTFPLPHERFCKQCGKGFQSLKALCGHMACHSEKDKNLKDDNSWTSDNPKLVMDSHSDTEAEDQMRQTRSKSKRYNKIDVKSSYNNVVNNDGNVYSYVSEIDEQEVEDLAMSLIILSKDTRSWGGVSSVVESSDNNSVVLETKSSSIDMKNGSKKGSFNFGDESMEFKKLGDDRKLKLSVLDDESDHLENSYSGYLRNGGKKVDSDISVDEVLRNGEYKNKGKCYETGLSNGLTKEMGFGEAGSSSKSKRNREDYYEIPEARKEFLWRLIYELADGELSKNAAPKRSKYECLNCKKTFNSHQALGGHRPCHKKPNGAIAERLENNIEDDDISDSTPIGKLRYKKQVAEKKVKSKKSKGHECPYCFRMFKSGQALGGHKRSHFINGSDDFTSQTRVIKQDDADNHDLIDLNLPAPEGDEADENDEFIY